MELSEIRTKLDTLDRELLALFVQRMELSGEVARCKAQHHLPVRDPQREQEILDRVRCEAGVYGEDAVLLYETLFSLSRRRQERLLQEEPR